MLRDITTTDLGVRSISWSSRADYILEQMSGAVTDRQFNLPSGYTESGQIIDYESPDSNVSVRRSIVGSGSSSAVCSLIPGVRRNWNDQVTRDLSSDGFTDATGLFRDGNDLWVIEPNILVAAKFTIQDDGTIVRNLG